ncbi:MAG: hypothetical protein ACJAYN_001801 [Bermanella sp.]
MLVFFLKANALAWFFVKLKGDVMISEHEVVLPTTTIQYLSANAGDINTKAVSVFYHGFPEHIMNLLNAFLTRVVVDIDK